MAHLEQNYKYIRYLNLINQRPPVASLVKNVARLPDYSARGESPPAEGVSHCRIFPDWSKKSRGFAHVRQISITNNGYLVNVDKLLH